MDIVLNGVQTTITEMSLIDFIRSLDIDPQRVAVELNLEIVPKSRYDATLLKDGDRIEIVQFVGGG